MRESFKFIAWAWVLGTTGYVLFDLWDDYKIRGIQQAHRQGADESVLQIMDALSRGGCAPLGISAGERKMQILSAECLPSPGSDPGISGTDNPQP